MSAQPRISASRVPMLLGESKYGTPLSLFHELRGDAPPREDNELLEEGRTFERAIAEIGCRKFNLRLVSGPKELAHGDLVGHPDFYVIDEHGRLAILEIKHTLFSDGTEDSGWGEAGTDRVPLSYLLQAMVYGHLLLKCSPPARLSEELIAAYKDNLLTDFAHALRDGLVSDTVYLVARLWHGTRLYRIQVDPQIIAKIESEASAFLDRVARGEPPDPTTLTEFGRRWTPVPEKATEFSEADFAVLKSLLALQQQIKVAEAEETKLKLYLAGRMQDNAIGTYRGKKVLSYTADRKFDERAFAEANPELWGGPACRSFDPSILRHENPALYEAFLRHPPAEQQTRKLRPAKGIEGL